MAQKKLIPKAIISDRKYFMGFFSSFYRACCAACLLPLFLPALAHAAGTLASTTISNTATASYVDVGGTTRTVNSNTASMKVDEILNCTVVSNDAGNVSTASPQSAVPLSFKVTNNGNAPEAYALSFNNNIPGDQFNPVNTQIYIDNGDGVFNPTTDKVYTPGTDPVIPVDGSETVFVVSDIPTGLSNGNIGLLSFKAESDIASAAAGVSKPGTTFAGKGLNGVDAVVGATTAQSTVQNGYSISSSQVSLTKTQSISDQFGGTNPIPGATVTYNLVFAANGTGSITGVKVVDGIPTNTTYLPGSITLDGTSLTDAVDADSGRFDTTNNQIEVDLNSVTVPVSHTVTFKVKIN